MKSDYETICAWPASPKLKPEFDKLNTLANFIEDLPHQRFIMPAWASDDATMTSCGTAGCACGWAATIWADEGWSFCQKKRLAAADDDVGFSAHLVFPVYGPAGVPCDPIFAFACFLQIPRTYARWITCGFNTDERAPRLIGYLEEYNLMNAASITPKVVAARIRKVIRLLGGKVIIDHPAPKSRLAELVK